MRTCFLLVAIALVSACTDDKAAHFAVGAASSAAVTHYTGSRLAGCGTALALGVAKEAYDRNQGARFDPQDVGATTAGCVVTLAF